MWTSTMDLDFKKTLLMRLLGRFYRNIYFSSHSPLQVQNLPRQSLPESNWVRVRNRLAGISGSDLYQLYGNSDLRVATTAGPGLKHYYPGHEVVGEVIEIGDDVRYLNVGDRVVLQYDPNCYTADVQPLCRACAQGRFHLCEQGALLAAPPLGGGWSEEMLLHEQQLYRVPETLTDEQAVMLEPAAIALHAVLQRLPQSGDRVLIIGAGTIGLLTQQIIQTLVPQAEISVLARYSFQVEQATRQGATHIIYPRDAYVGIQRATQARLYHGLLGNRTLLGGYDVIYDTVGQNKTLHHALRWTRAGGTVVLVGRSPHMMHIDLTPLWSQEISLLGSTAHDVEFWPLHSQEQRTTFEVVTELIEHNRINPEQLITHHFALTNHKNALLTATDKATSRAIKVVFDYSLLPASVVPNVRASAPKVRRPTTINFRMTTKDLDEMQPVQHSSTSIPAPRRTPVLQNQTGTRYTRPVSNDDYDDDDTATALPSIKHRVTRDIRSQTSIPVSQTHLESAAIPRPSEYTREAYPGKPIPSTPPITPEPAIELEDVDMPTQRVSRDEIKKYLADALAADLPRTEIPTENETPAVNPVHEAANTSDETKATPAIESNDSMVTVLDEEVSQDIAATTIDEEAALDSANTTHDEETSHNVADATMDEEASQDVAATAIGEEASLNSTDITETETPPDTSNEIKEDSSSLHKLTLSVDELSMDEPSGDNDENTEQESAVSSELSRVRVPAGVRNQSTARSRNRKKKGGR
jgi:2-desacetyl-2-hydroxyethyl bacteriochlorophyllide A dehydrogenase